MIRFRVKHRRPSTSVEFFKLPATVDPAMLSFDADYKTEFKTVSFSEDGLEKIEEIIWSDAAMVEWDAKWAAQFNALRDTYNSQHGIVREIISTENL